MSASVGNINDVQQNIDKFQDNESNSDDDSDDNSDELFDTNCTDRNLTLNSDDSSDDDSEVLFDEDSTEDDEKTNTNDESKEENERDEDYREETGSDGSDEEERCEESHYEDEYIAPGGYDHVSDPGSRRTLDDSSELLYSSEVTTVKDLINDCRIRFDIDSVIISSNFLSPMIKCLNETAYFKINDILSPLSASKSSRLRVFFDQSFPMSNHNKTCNQLSLGKFPNVTLATITVERFTMNLHFFWLNPKYIPKVSYFEGKYMLPITAALNIARLCLRGIISMDNDYFDERDRDILRKQSTHILPFKMSNCKGIVPKSKEVPKSTALPFFLFSRMR